MKRKLVVISTTIIFLGIIFSSFKGTDTNKTSGLCDSPVVGDHSGAPGELPCTGCHGGTANTGGGLLDFNLGGGITQYVAGQTYTGVVHMKQGTLNKFGFVTSILKTSDNGNAGSFTVLDGVRTRKYTLGGRNYFSHTPCGADTDTAGTITWTFTWTAPSTNVGTIKVYMAGLAANHNDAVTGDLTYTLTKTLTFGGTTGITEAEENKIELFPNPVSDKITIKNTGLSVPIDKIEFYDIAGKASMIEVSPTFINSKIDIDVSAFSQGIYFVKISSGEKIITKKIAVSRW